MADPIFFLFYFCYFGSKKKKLISPFLFSLGRPTDLTTHLFCIFFPLIPVSAKSEALGWDWITEGDPSSGCGLGWLVMASVGRQATTWSLMAVIWTAKLGESPIDWWGAVELGFRRTVNGRKGIKSRRAAMKRRDGLNRGFLAKVVFLSKKEGAGSGIRSPFSLFLKFGCFSFLLLRSIIFALALYAWMGVFGEFLISAWMDVSDVFFVIPSLLVWGEFIVEELE